MESRFSRYFLYALGEIVLVVIGILIALQVNTWNEEQKKHRQEEVYLQNLKEDLNIQIQSLDSYIGFQSLIIDRVNEIVEHYNQHQRLNDMDMIFQKLNDLTVRKTFTNKNTTLTELINSGDINLIRNRELKKDLLEFNNRIITVMNVTQNNNTNLTDRMILPAIKHKFGAVRITDPMSKGILDLEEGDVPFVMMNEEIRELMNRSLEDQEYQLDLLSNIVFRRTLAMLHKKMNIELKERSEGLLEQIEIEL